MYFNDWLTPRRRYSPDRVAIVDDDQGNDHSYGQLHARATTLAAWLRNQAGIRAGDRVACLSTNRIEYLDLYFACGKVGAVLVPLNFRLTPKGIAELLDDCRPALLLYEDRFADVVASIDLPAASINGSHSLDRSPWEDCAGNQLAGFVPHVAEEDEAAMILYTSGTTGRAKGAMISWKQIHWNALNTTIGLSLTERDVAFLNMPLHHTGGWHVLFTPLMLLGGRLVLQSRFDPQRCNERAGPEGVTILFGVPTTLRMMCEAVNFKQADFSSVRFAIFGGEACPLDVIEAYQRRGVAMRQGYGLTEAGPNCFSLPGEDAVRKLGSIGFANFFIETQLVTDDGQPADHDQVGELWMKGPHVFLGYWKNEVETAAALRDGWILTGDLMKRDAEGYHYVVGRKKEMYISGGENVYPAQVERVLQQHDAVSLAAVVSCPHARWGETGVAFVQLSNAGDVELAALHQWCSEHLAKYQRPSHIEVLSELPLAHNGKVDKLELRARLKTVQEQVNRD